MRMRMAMRVIVGFTRAVLVFVFMPVAVIVAMIVWMIMVVIMLVGTAASRRFSGQPASAIFTHYSISIEANSNSRPDRRSPLGL
jgi:hypothetical protein